MAPRRSQQRGGFISTPVYRGQRGLYSSFHLPPASNYSALISGRGQIGTGLGSFLGGLFRAAVPLLTSAGKAVGRQALSTGVDLARDFAFNPEMRQNPKQALKRRFENAGDQLTERFKAKVARMTGSGRRRRRSTVTTTTTTRRRRRRTQKGGFIPASDQQIANIVHRAIGSSSSRKKTIRRRRRKPTGKKTTTKRRRRRTAATTQVGTGKRKRTTTKRRTGGVSRRRVKVKRGSSRSVVDIFSPTAHHH